MNMAKKQISKRKLEILVIVFGSAVSFLALIFALLSLNNISSNPEPTSYFKNYFFLTFLMLALVRLPIIYHERTKFNIVRNVIVMTLYIAIAVVVLFLNFGVVEYALVSIAYVLSIFVNRLLRIFASSTIRSRVINIILCVLSILVILIFLSLAKANDIQSIMALLLVLIIGLCVVDVLFFAFSKIRLGAMIKIIQRTYAFEILYGLFVLILSFAYLFYTIEPNINSFGDGLWYSFAIVTAIGFGDMAAVTPIGRDLSVLLGVYGLIVVAVLTSIIINFYNETIKKDDDKELKKIASEEEKEKEQNKK